MRITFSHPVPLCETQVRTMGFLPHPNPETLQFQAAQRAQGFVDHGALLQSVPCGTRLPCLKKRAADQVHSPGATRILGSGVKNLQVFGGTGRAVNGACGQKDFYVCVCVCVCHTDVCKWVPDGHGVEIGQA